MIFWYLGLRNQFLVSGFKKSKGGELYIYLGAKNGSASQTKGPMKEERNDNSDMD